MPFEEEYKSLVNECDCEACRNMCKQNRPCWGTPQDIEKIIDAGHADQLMLDYWSRGDRDINIVVPGVIISDIDVYVKCRAPFWPIGQCVFYRDDIGCTIHAIKPLEGRIASCKYGVDEKRDKIVGDMHKRLAEIWDTENGERVIRKWKKAIGARGYL